jgi:subtilisin-like proprotein convertase family protein
LWQFGVFVAEIWSMHYTALVPRRQKFIVRCDLRIFLCALFLVASTVFAQAQTTGRQELRGHIPEAVRRFNLQPIGLLASTNRLHLAIGLPLRNPEALNTLLQQIYDPTSPFFHQYLTPEQFTEKFGPTEQDYQAVMDFAKANRLTVTTTFGNRVLLDIEGNVPDIERALHITMRIYNHPRENRQFHAPDTEPSLDIAVPILHIGGLDDYSLPRPANLVMHPSLQSAAGPPKTGSGSGGTFLGNDYRAAYVPGTPLTGTGQTVGLLQFDGYFTNDITRYENLAGISSVTLTNIPIDGGVATPGSGVGEVSLDIEMVISMAPGVSRVMVYEAPNPSPWEDLVHRIAMDNQAKQISCSWSGGAADPTAEAAFLQMAVQGQSFFCASGDTNAVVGTFPFPTDSTNITEVGGTTLTTTGAGGSYSSETVWNWFLEIGASEDGVGSSGGISTLYPIPPWQQGVGTPSNKGSSTLRNVPDVALTADNVFVAYGNGTTNWFGGTSCAAPLWAGFTALINQQAATNSLPPVGFLNPALYAIGNGPSYTSCFHDITTGNNTWSGSTGRFFAVTGYDLCTGWGTPNGINLINALTTKTPLITGAGATLTAEGCTVTNGAIDPGETVTLNFSLKNAGFADASNVVATLLATNGVASPSGPQNYGVLLASGGSNTQSFTFTANGTCGGSITPTLQVQDGSNNLGTITFPFGFGMISATTNSFANTGTITIPTSGNNGRSTPYPSTLSVSGITGLVSKVTVTLTNVSHTWVSDLDILLVGPGGQKVMIMSDVGNDASGTPISHQTFTFDDNAASLVPSNSPIVSGTYKPTDYLPGDVLGSPAPAGPYGTLLSVFNAVNPNGIWSLYVFDDVSRFDGGSISNGWKLNIITTTNSCCVGAINSNSPPVISAASISPVSPTTTNDLVVTITSTNDPDNDPITFTYQWQQSPDNITFTNLAFTASILPAAATVAGDYYQVMIIPNDGQTNGAPFTTASVLVPVDADGNGINDDWEVQYFGHIGIDPNADTDGTGQDNLFKYVAGLDPTNPASVFIFQVAAVTNQNAQDDLLFNPLASGRTYTPQFNTDLVNGAWAPLTNYLGPVTNGNQVTITDTNAVEPNKFYRLDISFP